jgi:predicted permease
MLNDFRYALRTLRQNPGFALVAIISLALGIGANAAIYSMADAFLLRPMAVPRASEVMAVLSQLRGENLGPLGSYGQLSYPDYRDLRDRSQSFAGLTAAQYAPFGFATEKNALPEMKYGTFVSGNFFPVLEIQPVLGRAFRPEEDQAVGRDAVVILGYDLWKRALAARPDAIGTTIYLNGIPFTVIGVAPPDFLGPYNLIRSDLFVPLAMEPNMVPAGLSTREKRASRGLFVHGRLKPGVSGAQAAAEGRVIGQQLEQAYPDTNRSASMVVDTDLKARLRLGVANALIVGFLSVLSVVVLLIACANVMNLMLSRARARAREIAIRLAIGAGRRRLVRQLLTESLVISILGGALGLVVAEAGVDLFSSIRIPSDIPIVIDMRLDARVLLFSLCVAVVSALVFGLAPALQSTQPDLVPALKSNPGQGGKRRRFLGRNALVIAQVAGSLILLVFATQSYRGAAIVLSSPMGFRTDHLLLAGFNPSLARYTTEQTVEFYRNLLDRARLLPGVKSAALTQGVPMMAGGVAGARIIPEGVTLPDGTEAITTLSNTVSDGYFEAQGIPLVEGRGFEKTDRADTRRVAIVNELVARKYYPKQSAIGKRFRLVGDSGAPLEIVGVAKQSKYVFAVEPPLEFVYLPMAQHIQAAVGGFTPMTLLLQTSGPSSSLAGPLRQLVRSIDSQQPVLSLRTMEDYFDQRAIGTLGAIIDAIAGLGVLGLILALVGLYGLMTYSVGLRRREIGIRMAVGANQARVLKMVLQHGLLLALIGVAIGLLFSLVAGKSVTALLGTSSFNLPLLASVAAALVGAAALGAYIPARRASRLDPNVVLRQE